MAIGDEGIARIGAIEDGAQLERRLQIDRHVLQTMHGQIGAAVEQGVFEFLDEEPLAAHLGEGAVEDLVASGRQGEEFNRARRIQRAQPIAHMLGLPQGKPAGAGRDDQALR